MMEQKVFNDSIHGHISFPPLCIKIIDTPEFQRLRFIKQIGSCYFVYPGASHNRFEHSLGVCYLAGELVETICKNQPTLGITGTDILCVKIAGLCHDLGHGPFSHLFDGLFQSKIKPKTKWRHEDISVAMFEYLIDQNHLDKEFRQYGISATDLTFIKEQIGGPCEKYEGRDEDKWFLYEIVANKRNGFDVDKWDYLARDCLMLGIQNTFDFRRYLKYARVIKVGGERQICTRDKQYIDLYDLLHTRKKLHDIACKHRISNLIDIMLTDALVQANPHLKFTGSRGEECTMTEAIEHRNMSVYVQLTDSVIFDTILYSNDDDLTDSQQLIKQILQRKFYHLIFEAVSKKGQVYKKADDEKVIDEILNTCCCNKENDQITKEEIALDIASTDFSREKDDPINSVRFYRKSDINVGVQINKGEVSTTFPERFDDQRIRLYCKEYSQEKMNKLKHLFEKWCDKNQFSTPTKES